MKDKRPQFVPGYLAAVARTPIITAGELPGGGDLFRTCTRAVVEHQLGLALPEGGEPEPYNPPVLATPAEVFAYRRPRPEVEPRRLLDGPAPCDCEGGCTRAHAAVCERCGAAAGETARRLL